MRIYLPAPDRVKEVAFSVDINYKLAAIAYSYDNTTWFNGTDYTDVVKKVIPANLFALSFEISLQKTNDSYTNCTNVTVILSNEVLLPKLEFSTSDGVLDTKKVITITMTGQKTDMPECFLHDKKNKLDVALQSSTKDSNMFISKYVVTVVRKHVYPFLCGLCEIHLCNFVLMCQATYPGNQNKTTEQLTFTTNIYASSLKSLSVSSNETDGNIRGTTDNNGCNISFIQLKINGRTRSLSLRKESFSFVLKLNPCEYGDVTVTTYSALNVSGNVTASSFIFAQPRFDVSAQVTQDKTGIQVSWNGTTCVERYDDAEISYKEGDSGKFSCIN